MGIEGQKHSPIGASSAYRWFECPGSVALSEKCPKSLPSSYAIEGTKAHEYLADVLTNKKSLSEIPEPFYKPLKLAIDIVRSQLAEAGVGNKQLPAEQRGVCLVERTFDLSHIVEGLYGTADIVIVDKRHRRLTVIDYKHGAGIAVEAENNKQLLYYALGAFNSLKDNSGVEHIRIQIIQPRLGDTYEICKTWDTDPFTLIDFALELKQKAEETKKQDAILKSGDWCRFCNAQAICPELRKVAMLDAAEDFKNSALIRLKDSKNKVIPKSGKALKVPSTDEEFAKALDWIPQILAWTKAVKEYAYRRMMSGDKIPGFKLVEKRKTRKWIDESEMIKFFQRHGLGDDEIFHKKIKSPAQMEKILNNIEARQIQGFILAESSGYALVAESDKRAAAVIDGSLDFSKLSLDDVEALTAGED